MGKARRRQALLFLLAVVLSAARPMPATAGAKIGFDDLPDTNIPRPHHGYYFINFVATDVIANSWIGYPPCSAPRAADSGVNMNAWITTNHDSIEGPLFDFDGACFSTYGGPWAPTELQVEGYRRGVLIKSITIPLKKDAMEFVGFRMLGVDTVVFTSNGTVGGYILMDNVTTSKARLPGALLLLDDH
jgi:hypothetical protein